MFTTKKSLRIVMWRQLCHILGKLHFQRRSCSSKVEAPYQLNCDFPCSRGTQFWGENRELFLAQNCLKRIMSPLLEIFDTKKNLQKS